MSTEIPQEFCPRLCHVVRWPDFEGYGFNLHAEKGKAGQFIGKVDENSPAEAAGLREGDRIVEVNGTNIGNENHQQVVTRIRSGGEETRLLVVDSAADEWFKTNKVVIKGDTPGVIYKSASRDQPDEDSLPEPEPKPEPEVEKEPEPEPAVVTNGNDVSEDSQHRPRLCHLKFWPNFQGYGFNLHAERDKPGQFIGLVDDDSPASTAGLRVNDRIVEVNGRNVEKEPHGVVIGYIKETHGETRLLVVDPQADKYFRNNGVIVHSNMAQVQYIATPDVQDNASELEAVADLDNIPDDIPDHVPAAQPEREDPHHDLEDVVDAANGPQAESEPEPEPEPELEPEAEPEIEKLEDQVAFVAVAEQAEPVEAVEPEQLPEEPVPEVEAVEAPAEDSVNGNKTQEAPGLPESEFTVASDPEPQPEPQPQPEPEPVKAAPAQEQPQLSAPAGGDDGLTLNLSVAEMKERIKNKKKQDPRYSNISFEKKYQQFERM